MKKNIITNLNNILERVVIKQDDICETLNKSSNLKLYEVASLDDLDIDIFNDFCSNEYNKWIKFLNEHHLAQVNIGRTSTFYLNPKHYDMYRFDSHGEMTIEKVIYLICEFSGLDTDFIKINKNGIVENLKDIEFKDLSVSGWEKYFLEDNSIDEIYKDLENEISSFFEEIDEMQKAYMHLENFKKNQLSTFNNYLTSCI